MAARSSSLAAGINANRPANRTPYYLQKEDIARFLEKFDEYKKEQKLA
jgi:hypothetical protein